MEIGTLESRLGAIKAEILSIVHPFFLPRSMTLAFEYIKDIRGEYYNAKKFVTGNLSFTLSREVVTTT